MGILAGEEKELSLDHIFRNPCHKIFTHLERKLPIYLGNSVKTSPNKSMFTHSVGQCCNMKTRRFRKSKVYHTPVQWKNNVKEYDFHISTFEWGKGGNTTSLSINPGKHCQPRILCPAKHHCER